MKNVVFILFGLLALSSCSKSIIVEKEPNIVFGNYKTYHWNVLEVSNQNPYYNNIALNQSLSKAIEHNFEKKGIKKTETNADFLVDFHVFVKENSFQKLYCPSGFYRGGRYLPELHNWPQCDVPLEMQSFDDGTLVIDIVDAKTKQLIWRGSSKNAINNPQYASDILSRKVNKVLKQLPIAVK